MMNYDLIFLIYPRLQQRDVPMQPCEIQWPKIFIITVVNYTVVDVKHTISFCIVQLWLEPVRIEI